MGDIRALDSSTWLDFERLVAAHNGVWGGCWCMGFHEKGPGWGKSAEMNRAEKECKVRNGEAHAALVYDGADCVGWCQFGTPDELPRIKYKRAYMASKPDMPDWRITCFFTAQGHRGKGVARAALNGAIELIAQAGGGVVEGYPDDTEAGKMAGAFLFNGVVSTFEQCGFTRDG